MQNAVFVTHETPLQTLANQQLKFLDGRSGTEVSCRQSNRVLGNSLGKMEAGFKGLATVFQPLFWLQGFYSRWHNPTMARANRLGGYGGIFHVTHRCHNREFLLKFALDRDGYRARVRDHLREFGVPLLDYCITSNHVHLLLDAEERSQISGLMRTVAGEFAGAYNRRKERMNAFWGDNFHATLVEEGTYPVALPVLHRAEHGALWAGGSSTGMGLGSLGSAGFLERIKPLILSRQGTELVQHDQEGSAGGLGSLRRKNGLEKGA